MIDDAVMDDYRNASTPCIHCATPGTCTTLHASV